MALTGFTAPADLTIDPESVDTVSTSTFTTAASSVFANGTGNFANGQVDLDITLSLDQDFIATDTAHPDGAAADLTVQAQLFNGATGATAVTIANGNTAKDIGDLAGSNGTLLFTAVGLEEGCELTIDFHINNNSNSDDTNVTKITVSPVTGLNNCDFQSVLKYQQLNQKMNNRFDADTKEFSSFKTMRKRMKKIK